MPPGANDNTFAELWPRAEAFVREAEPEFILVRCGADSIDGDPITHMAYSSNVHSHALDRICIIADEFCDGRVVAMGGGGYNLDNIASAWTAVVSSLVNADQMPISLPASG